MIHTHYSILESNTTIDKLYDFCLANNWQNCIITDTNSLSGFIDVLSTFKEVKPIIGVEFRNEYGYFTLLAINQQGLSKLISLVSDINENGLLNEYTGDDNLYCISGYQDSDIRRSLHDTQLTQHLVKNYQSKFKDRFYLGVDDSETSNQIRALGQTIPYSPCFSLDQTCDLDVLLKIQERDSTLNRTYPKGFNFKTFSSATKEEKSRLCAIVQSCEKITLDPTPLLPKFCDNEISLVRQLCLKGWNKLIEGKVSPSDRKIYADRMKYELSVIESAKLAGYFLIVQDYIN